ADGTVKISGFTFAKLADESVPEELGAVIGTPAFMAPEQARGEDAATGPPADIWALGVILYECLTGRRPFEGHSPMELLHRVRGETPQPPRHLAPSVPRDLEAICLKCMEHKIEDRYTSAEALAGDLRLFLEASPITARPAGVLERGWKWAQRHPTAVAL